MKKDLVIGIMSGSSLDGLDGVLIQAIPKRGHLSVQTIAHLHRSYTKSWANKVREIARNNQLREAYRFGLDWSKLAAHLVVDLLKKSRVSSGRVLAIGAHGQTVVHEPSQGITIQLADLSTLAMKTGIPVVGNFRAADLAVGGQGAPLVPHAHKILFGRAGKTVAIQNFGGIGNVTLVKGHSVALAFDTGPGNCWIDTVMRWHTKGKQNYDRDGALAAQGLPDLTCVKQICSHRYFEKGPPKSTGWEEFGEADLRKYKGRLLALSPADASATVTLATALATAAAYRKFVFPNGKPTEIIVAGGGGKNKFLMEMFAKLLPECQVVTSTKYGVGVDQLEAAAFALLALQTMRGVPSNEPAATGARRRVILGHVAFPS